MRKITLALIVPLLLQAHTLAELFDALKHHAQTKSDEMSVQKAHIAKAQADARLYPTIDLFGKYDNFSVPTGMLPIPPNTLFPMIQNQNIPQPFSYNIYRLGASISMPIFVKSIFTYAEKAEAMARSAQVKKRINRLKNEAVIVGTNANFRYLNALEKALEGKQRSLKETQKTLQIKVDSGRAPASALYKINDGLNQIAIAKNNIALQRSQIVSTIEGLTGIVLDAPVPMTQTGNYQSGAYASLEPLRKKIEADRLGVRAEQEKLYPALFAKGSYVRSYGDSYNNHTGVYESYGDIGVILNIPILHMDQYEAITKAELEVASGEVELEKAREELQAKARALESSLPLLDNSVSLYGKSVEDKKRLLEIAKVNYKNGRLSTEEYLRYEDDVIDAEAKRYKAQTQKWQTLMQLAVIYANPIEEIVQ